MSKGVFMNTYECIVKAGHMGAGNYRERYLRVKADSILQAFDIAKSLPGVKKGRQQFSGGSVLKVCLVH